MKRVAYILGAVILATSIAVVARPALFMAHVWILDRDERVDGADESLLDDASRLELTEISSFWEVPSTIAEAEKALADILMKAQQQNVYVSIAGARHSMGGHTLITDGLVINMLPLNFMKLEKDNTILHVGSGALWSDIVPFLDAHGKSVAVMQSDNVFSVGGSISVNCHGWQYDRPPISSTVQSFRIMLADGSIVTASRESNAELFSLALGGYGLFGVILDVRLITVPNERLRYESEIIQSEEAVDAFQERVENKKISMAYARVNITREDLFGTTVLNMFYRDSSGEIPELGEPNFVGLRRNIFIGSIGSNYGKQLRWAAETKLKPYLIDSVVSRNQLFNDDIRLVENRTSDTTNILHEYFIPHENAIEFMARVRSIVLKYQADLLNVTVRSVNEDTDTYLRYATQDVLAFVMIFHQSIAHGDETMKNMTQEIIHEVLSLQGTYYLPYRRHASKKQFYKSYPQAEEFFQLKRNYDPNELFQSKFYNQYK